MGNSLENVFVELVGLSVELYMGTTYEGSNLDFTPVEVEKSKHILSFLSSLGKKYEIHLWETDGICYSGWTQASWGEMEVKEVEKFRPFTHIPKTQMRWPNIEYFSFRENGYLDLDLFSVHIDNGCQYYPSGWYSVNMDFFKETSRVKHKRPVWIFKGPSAVGKSYLANHLQDITVYETDSQCYLPNTITASVIVLGNKYDYTVKEVKKRLPENVEVHVVKFK